MGRHDDAAERGHRHGRLGLAVTAFVLVLIVTAGSASWLAWRSGVLPEEIRDALPCAETTRALVIVDPKIAPSAVSVASGFRSDAARCVSIRVRTQGSADAAAVIGSASETAAAAWIPDSSVWIERMSTTATALGRAVPSTRILPAVASTPVVFAVPSARAADWVDQPPSWAGVLSGRQAAVLVDPGASSTSLAALLAMRGASGEDERAFASAIIALGDRIAGDRDESFDLASASDSPLVAIATEQQVVARSEGGSAPWVALYPTDGTVSVAAPFVLLGDPPREMSADGMDVVAALTDFADALRADGEALSDAGYRRADGGGLLDQPGVKSEPTIADAALDPGAQLEVLRSWSVLTLRSRMLAVIDVSGSMLEPVGGGLRRIDVFQQAALGAVERFPGEAELGVWAFSTDRVGDRDWEELAPVQPLNDPSHVQRIGEVVASLPSLIRGDTGLYDTILDAVDSARASYDPDKVNSVLVITDGRNEDDGLTLDQLLAELAARDDPERPVPVIIIGFGPDTDLPASRQIAEATRGGSYTATRPEDLGTVLVDALSQRTCRPSC
ncbi:VWA domain-containing protein [Microcella daejeonensis]|uniref:VWA domain-containing protein n=1 Tax=Microcella daejeonensis TaxID=2994971 RepID=UPI00226E09B2|nr:VWA domain-containing protein [Microcella daejeonensis]WAB83933.1 VWA domain-containing protein [Microcella daejeonensis]